jgi:CHAT domain-containing protein/Tfp pilus assembly protein PilF
LYKRSLAIMEKALGPEHPNVAQSLNNIAANYGAQGRYGEAEPLYKRSLAIKEKALGPNHPDVAQSLNNLALNYNAQGRYAEAEPLLKRSLAIYEKALGPEHPNVATSLNNIALNYNAQGRYAEAEPLLKRSLAIWEKALGPDHPNVAQSLNNIADNYRAQARYGEAEPLYKRSLAIREKALGANHPDVAQSLNNLALNYSAQGRYAEAEPLLKRSLAIMEKALGPEHPDVATSLNNIALNYNAQGRYAEAEPLYKRSLAIREKALGQNHPDVAQSLNNLALNYNAQGRYAEAEPLFKRSLAIMEKALGPEHPSVAQSLNNIAFNYNAQGRYGEAEPLYKRSLAIKEKALGPNHPDVAQSLNNLALNYSAQGRYAEAEPLLKRSLAIWEKALVPDHPDVARVLGNLSMFYSTQSDQKSALTFIRRASSILRKRLGRALGERSIGGTREQLTKQGYHLFHVRMVSRTRGALDEPAGALKSESFEAGQLANVTAAGSAVSRMAVRFAAGDDQLAKLVRSRQDTLNSWRLREKELIEALGQVPDKRNKELKQNLRRQLASLDDRLISLDEQLTDQFPTYTALTTRQPLALSHAQSLVGPDEALLTYLVGDEESYLWVVRRDRSEFYEIELTGLELAKAVQALRKGLDPKGITSLKQMPPFDTTKAYELYKKLFAPAEKLLEGVRHVMVVPDGALQSLPLGVLVTKEHQGSFKDFSGYRQVPWLAKKYAMTTLPSVSSLRALRTFAKRTRASRPFLGVGDPKLEGETGSGRGVKLASLFTPRGVADVESVRQLASLPKTAGELKALARTLGAGNDALILGTEATETRVKQETLKDYKVLAFATHGLVAGDIEGLVEPALVLTPPRKGTDLDDGLLTASEVAQLKLDADWVILSACNTASPDGTPGAEGLSGLAKAFFYAGSRALLVSHWQVESDAAVKITTRMLSEAQKPGVGRVEAHRQAMLALMNDGKKPHYAHPMFWAPFVVVGEGGR